MACCQLYAFFLKIEGPKVVFLGDVSLAPCAGLSGIDVQLAMSYYLAIVTDGMLLSPHQWFHPDIIPRGE
jgi:hypothetical protein